MLMHQKLIQLNLLLSQQQEMQQTLVMELLVGRVIQAPHHRLVLWLGVVKVAHLTPIILMQIQPLHLQRI